MSQPIVDPIEAALAARYRVGDGAQLLPYMISGLVNWTLLGVIIVMFVQWSSHRRDEKRSTICVVVLSMISTLASSVYLVAWLCKAFVWNFGSYKQFALIHYEFSSIHTCNLADLGYSLYFDWSTTAIQLFYTERAYRLNKNKIWILLAVIPIMIVTWVIHIYAVWHIDRLYEYNGPELFNDKIAQAGLYTWLSTAVYCDILITGSIAYALWKHKSGWKSTDSIIHKLIKVSLETQLPGLLASVLMLATWGNRTVGVIFLTSQPNLYVIGFLAMCNFRFTNRDALTASLSRSGAQVYPLEPGLAYTSRVNTTMTGNERDIDSRGKVRVEIETHTALSPRHLASGQKAQYTNRGPWSDITELPSCNDSASQRTTGTGKEGYAADASDSNLNDWAGKDRDGA